MTTQTRKIAIVTGASTGIGATVAERLAKDGYTVVVNYAGNTVAAEALVTKIKAAGGQAITAQADVANPDAVRRMFDSTETAFGGVDVLINNAGIMTPKPIADSDDALFLDGKSKEAIAGYAKLPPLERLGQPEDIANVISFLVGPEGGWINGQVLRANGGII